jgi:hypothetical protein
MDSLLSQSNSPKEEFKEYRVRTNTDKHTVFVTDIGPIDGAQLNTALGEYFGMCRKKLGIEDPKYFGMWKINIVKNKENEPIGVSYIFFEKEVAYHVITGKNPDGSKREKEIPNPDFKEQPAAFNFDMFSMGGKVSWADIVEEEAKKTIIVAEAPIARFPDITLSPKQQALTKRKTMTPNIKPCSIAPPTSDLDRYTLFGSNIPAVITAEHLKDYFKPYITCKKDLDSGFPQVTLIRGKAYIKFPSHNNDSMFALLMTKKVLFRMGDGSNITLFFTYARDNKRM